MVSAGRRLPVYTCNQAKTLLFNDNWSCRHVAERLHIHKRTVERMRLSYELFDQPYPPPFGRVGRPRALTTAQEAVSLVIPFFKLSLSKPLP